VSASQAQINKNSLTIIISEVFDNVTVPMHVSGVRNSCGSGQVSRGYSDRDNSEEQIAKDVWRKSLAKDDSA